MNKFKLTTEYIEKFGRKAFRIEATMDFELPWPFGKIKKGDKGGYVEKEEFLIQTARGWVFEDGEIWGGVIHDGVIHDGVIHGGVIHDGVIHGGVIHGGVIHGGVIHGGVIRGGEIWGGVIRGGEIRGGEIWGGEIWGGVIRGGVIRGASDLFVACGIGSSGAVLTAVRYPDGTININRGCFNGTLTEFKKAVTRTHKKSKNAAAYKLLISYIEYHFNTLYERKAK